jgi:hypothetical protein
MGGLLAIEYISNKGYLRIWARLIKKIYEVDPLTLI